MKKEFQKFEDEWIDVNDRLPGFIRKDPSRPMNEQGDENTMTASKNVLVDDTE